MIYRISRLASVCLLIAGCTATGADLTEVTGTPAVSVSGEASQSSVIPTGTVAAWNDIPVQSASLPPGGVSPDELYFIEFRSRSALSYGHTFAVHGRLNTKGEIVESTVVGLHPRGNSAVPWMIGHVVPVPAETGASDGDTELQYMTANYRITMGEDRYKEVLKIIADLEAKSPVWHAVFYNCNMYVQNIAEGMGLRLPMTTWVYPEKFISRLRELNEGKPSEARAKLPQSGGGRSARAPIRAVGAPSRS
jgi:hypothetical protein